MEYTAFVRKTNTRVVYRGNHLKLPDNDSYIFSHENLAYVESIYPFHMKQQCCLAIRTIDGDWAIVDFIL